LRTAKEAEAKRDWSKEVASYRQASVIRPAPDITKRLVRVEPLEQEAAHFHRLLTEARLFAAQLNWTDAVSKCREAIPKVSKLEDELAEMDRRKVIPMEDWLLVCDSSRRSTGSSRNKMANGYKSL
jgi:hypothetical protein